MKEQDRDYLNNTLKPRLFFPIFNTLFALAFIGFVIYLTIEKDLSPWVLVLSLVLGFLYPLSSWYNSYFSRLKQKKMVYNLQEETELMVDCARVLRNKTSYELTPDHHVDFNITYDANAPMLTYTFNLKTRSFEPLKLSDKNINMICLCISFCGLAIDAKTQQVIGVVGMAPCSIWNQKRLTPPFAKRGIVTVDWNDFPHAPNSIYKYLEKQEIYYDSKTGWLCFGNKRTNSSTEVVEIADYIYIVAENKDLKALWVKIEPNLAIR